jgi:Na+-transporting methylmalonyl-CoA/oxaloacetate decarboxylase gamma subunit
MVISSLTLEFGLTLTGLGILAMFSALSIIIVVCELLKRLVKAPESEKSTLNTLDKEGAEELTKISMEEETAIAAAIMTYISDSTSVSRQIITIKRGNQPLIWSGAGRFEIMELSKGGR